ncbi:hypothetical protein BD626DRAFT_30124 [Schizophyllum amplum]|uniref:NAD(P)-binding protein n=1 Tax=Schizophyllum amplum TaxID=97359 RepID=A0A550D0G0_9AGAR|nr:hypothetical protein BD626DRAFT_30124 [Auriculariopsis ampla]
MSPTVHLISGANRGIGLNFVKILVQRPDVVVFAGARKREAATELHALAEAHPGKLHVVALTSADRGNNDAAIAEVKRVAGRLDVVIANAGICDTYVGGLDVSPADMTRHFEVNVNGPLVLFQAVHGLMSASTPTPKFVLISTAAGSISMAALFAGPIHTYGASKAALNWLSCKLHAEFPAWTIFPINPGAVATGMMLDAQKTQDWLKDYPLTSVEESTKNMMAIIDKATREGEGGQFLDASGEKIAW